MVGCREIRLSQPEVDRVRARRLEHLTDTGDGDLLDAL
jgi:hypothetical protein